MKRLVIFIPVAIALAASMVMGCASTQTQLASKHSLKAHAVLVGRFVTSEEFEVFYPIGGRELSHVSEAWTLQSFETLKDPKVTLNIANPFDNCPSRPLGDKTYVVVVQKDELTTLEGPKSRVAAELTMVACAPVDGTSSAGFLN